MKLKNSRNEPAKVVASLIGDAIDHAGKALALGNKIEPLIGRRYSDRTISAWGRGGVMPPADVFVAALKATGISLDERLGIGREPTEVEQQMASLKEELQKQRQRIAALEALQQNQE